MDAPVSQKQARYQLVEQHRDLIQSAIEAVDRRHAWSPFSDSPSTKVHGPQKPAAGKTAFETHLGQRFELNLPGVIDWVGAETSPYTCQSLGITYERCEPEALIAAAESGWDNWAKAEPELRIALCTEMALRLYEANFEMAHAIMHVAGQSYTQAFSGSGPNALDRGIEALAYAAKSMNDVARTARYERRFAGEKVVLDKTYALVPRGIGLVICCASFPTWNAYPAMFASLATGNPVILKPHPIAILPMAIVARECRKVLSDYGFDPELITLAVDTLTDPVAQVFIDHPAVQIIDFTGSPRFGGYLEKTVTGKLLFTETAGVNTVVVESVDEIEPVARAIARAACLFSAQMCTSPQVVYVAPVLHTAFGRAIVRQVNEIADDAQIAAAIMGAIQGEVSLKAVATVRGAVQGRPGVEVLREALPYEHSQFPQARTLTPLILSVEGSMPQLYAEEHFGPVLFVVKMEAEDAVKEATHLAKSKGSISSYLYSTDEAFIARSVPSYERAGANLTINLTGAMWINFAAAYSDFHVSGLNPAGNACLTDLAFVASRFRIVQRRRPA